MEVESELKLGVEKKVDEAYGLASSRRQSAEVGNNENRNRAGAD